MTGLSTPWHGSWSMQPGNVLHVEFDCRGRDTKKLVQVNLSTMEGHDYLHRHIVLQRVRTWAFNPDQAAYVMMSEWQAPFFRM